MQRWREASNGISRVNAHIAGNYSSSGTGTGNSGASKDSIRFNQSEIQW